MADKKPKPKHLIDISKRPDFKELVSKGGSMKTEKQRYTSIYRGCVRAKCRRCRLQCEFKEMNLEKDKECICGVPSLRADAILHKTSVIGFNEDKIAMWLSDVIRLFVKMYKDSDNDKEKAKFADKLYNKLLPLKEKYYPATQKNVNLGAQLIKVELVNPNAEKKVNEEEVFIVKEDGKT